MKLDSHFFVIGSEASLSSSNFNFLKSLVLSAMFLSQIFSYPNIVYSLYYIVSVSLSQDVFTDPQYQPQTPPAY